MPSCCKASIMAAFAPTCFQDSRAKKSCFKPGSLRPRPLRCCVLPLSVGPAPLPAPEVGLLYSLLPPPRCLPSLPESFLSLLALVCLRLSVVAAAAATARLNVLWGMIDAPRLPQYLLCQLQVIECIIATLLELGGAWCGQVAAAHAGTQPAACGGAARPWLNLQQFKLSGGHQTTTWKACRIIVVHKGMWCHISRAKLFTMWAAAADQTTRCCS